MTNRKPQDPKTEGVWHPLAWLRRGIVVFGKSLARLWGRDVMLYVGGVSFFAMLAAFPGLAIMVGLYGLLSDPNTVTEQAEAIANLMPPSAAALFVSEFERLSQDRKSVV